MRNTFKQLIAFIQKEFYHVFRDKKTLLIMFILPVFQVLIFGYAITNEVKNADLLVVNPSRSVEAEQIIHKIDQSEYFTLKKQSYTVANIEDYFKSGKINLALVFPVDFGVGGTKNNQVQLISDGTNPNLSKTVVYYIHVIMADYMVERGWIKSSLPLQIDVTYKMMYNPSLNDSMNTIPGVIALIMMIVCTTLTSVAVVREKEFGSMEVLLVSPFKPILVLVAKALPYLVLSIINLLLILGISHFVLGLPVNGSFWLLFAESILFIITCLAFGLLISNLTSSQAVAMLISMMGMLLPTLLFSGFLFPLDNMPLAYQWFSNLVPARWYFLVVKDVMIKGLSFAGIWKETSILLIMTIVLLLVSLRNFKIRLQ